LIDLVLGDNIGDIVYDVQVLTGAICHHLGRRGQGSAGKRINSGNRSKYAVGGLRLGLRDREAINRAAVFDHIDESPERVDNANVSPAGACRGWYAAGIHKTAGAGCNKLRKDSAAGINVVHQIPGGMDQHLLRVGGWERRSGHLSQRSTLRHIHALDGDGAAAFSATDAVALDVGDVGESCGCGLHGECGGPRKS
jgi:hypothetical protein